MAVRGIHSITPATVNLPLSRLDFIELTYTLITGRESEGYIKSKFFLKSKGIIDKSDIGLVKGYEGAARVYRYGTPDKAIKVTGTEPVLFKDTTETEEESKLSIMFDDMSVLSIGEDTVMEIGKMVYDPEKNTREVLLKLTLGKIRVKASKVPSVKTNFNIETPTAVIGLRGTEVIINVDRSGRTDVLTLEGLVAVRPAVGASARKGDAGKAKKGKSSSSGQASSGNGQEGSDGGSSSQQSPSGGSGSSGGSGVVLVGPSSVASVSSDAGVSAPVTASAEVMSSMVQGTSVTSNITGGGAISVNEAQGAANSVQVDVVIAQTSQEEPVASSSEESSQEPAQTEEDTSSSDTATTDVDKSESSNQDDADGDGVADGSDTFPKYDNGKTSTQIQTDIQDKDNSQRTMSTSKTASSNYSGRMVRTNFNDILSVSNPTDETLDDIAHRVYADSIQFDGAVTSKSSSGSDLDGRSYTHLGHDDHYNHTNIGFNFNFFGTTYSSVYTNTNGSLTFGAGDSDYTPSASEFLSGEPRISPIWTDLQPEDGGHLYIDNNNDTTPTVFRVRYSDVPYFWVSGTATATVMLFDDGKMAMTYGTVDTWQSSSVQSLLIGLSSGSDKSSASSRDLYNSGSSYTASSDYEAIYQYWDNLTTSLDFKGLLFEPVSGSGNLKYKVTPYDSTVIIKQVDKLRSSAEKMAVAKDFNDGLFKPGSYDTSAKTWSGTYSKGLQVVGQDADGNAVLYMYGNGLDNINNSDLLAYAVQVEEDIVNREALEQIRDLGESGVTRDTLWSDINSALDSGDIRERDAILQREADARTGRVVQDANGYWVRAQQYVIRPSDTTVEVLDINLRGVHASDRSGLTVMSWRTQFNSSITGVNLQTLPWADYTTTMTATSGSKYITNSSTYELNNMVAKLSHGQDWAKETRVFSSISGGRQDISSQTLEGAGKTGGGSFTYASDTNSSGTYTIASYDASTGGPTGFKYKFNDSGTQKEINALFYVIGNATSSSNTGKISGYSNVTIQDVWAALGTGITSSGASNSAADIGVNNLEMVLTNGTNCSDCLSQPLDIIYVPLKYMLWK